MTTVSAVAGRTALLALLALAAPHPVGAQQLFLRNAQLVDPGARTIRPGNVLITDGRIVGFPDAPPEDFTGAQLDVAGRWVMPALADMHTHSFGNAGAAGMPQMLGPTGVVRVALEAGVARVLDLFSAEDFIFTVREEQRKGKHPGAELLAAGPCLTATNGHCSEYGVPTRIVNTPAEAEREVNALARKHPDVVKVVYDHATYSGRTRPTIDRATLEAVVKAASDNGLRTVVHIGTWDDMRDAVEAGAAAVTHTPGPEPLPADLAALMVARGTVHIPTLAVQGDFSRFVDDPSLLDSELLTRIAPPALIDGYRAAPDSTNPLAGFVRWQRTLRASNLASVGALHQAGVPMLTGTDGGNPGVFQGYSVHRELQLLVESGLDPWDALAAGTVNAGRFLRQSWGLTTGAEGTLLVLERSPVDDIRNTEAIAAVIQRGELRYNTLSSAPRQ